MTLVITALPAPPDRNSRLAFGARVKVVAAATNREFPAGSRAYSVTCAESPARSDAGQFAIGSTRPAPTSVYAESGRCAKPALVVAISVSVPADVPVTRKYV